MILFEFLSGAVTMGFAVAGLYFLRFWAAARDSLFLAFAISFWLLGLCQALLGLADIPIEERSWVYVLRLMAFVTIIVAVVRKNRRRPE